MREEYDLEQLTVKRRGPLLGAEEAVHRPAKVRVTIALDEDVVAHFKTEAEKPGGLPYQTQINQALRRVVVLPSETEGATARGLQEALLGDPGFIRKVAEKVSGLIRPSVPPKIAESHR